MIKKRSSKFTLLKIFGIVVIFSLSSINSYSSELELVWEDNFNADSLDTDKWSYLIDGDGGGNNERQYYTDRPENLYFEDGKLVIRAKKENYEWADYTSARINTRGKKSFRYKSIRVRANLPAGTGTWPAIWMLGNNIDEAGWPGCGEIDIMEHVGYDPGIIHGTVHTEKYNHMNENQKGGSIEVTDATNSFHVYRIDWYNNKIVWYVDGDKYYTYQKEEGATWESWPFDQKFYLILNLAIGGDWGGVEGIDNSIFPVEMKIDWVKVYDMPILEIGSDTINLNMEAGNSSSSTSNKLELKNIGSGSLEGVSVNTDLEWLDLNWSDNSGNEQILKLQPNENAEKLLPGVYSGKVNITVDNANEMEFRVNLQIGENLGLNKQAKASSEFTNPITRRTDQALDAIDGDRNTKWKSGTDNNEWLLIDLQQTYKISNIRLFWRNEISTNGYSYEIQLSKDSSFSSYQVIAEKNNSRGGKDRLEADTSKTGRYLRLYGNSKGSFDRYVVSEIEIFGYQAATPIFKRPHKNQKFSLKNAPNPFNPSTNIYYTLEKRQRIKLSLYDIQGRFIKTLLSGYKNAGRHKIKYTVKNLSSGIYICRLVTPGNFKTTKFVLLK